MIFGLYFIAVGMKISLMTFFDVDEGNGDST